MMIKIKNFGELLVSRPDGREAYLALQSNQLKNLPLNEKIEIDFQGVKAIAPGWADGIITPLSKKFKNIKLLNTENSTVQATLKTLREYSDLKI
jgi:hypothetical protein